MTGNENPMLRRARVAVRGMGRPKGAGGYAETDRLLVAQMRAGIEAGSFSSIWAAAVNGAADAAGGGTPFAKTLRLYNRYTDLYGKLSQQPPSPKETAL